MNKMLDYLKWRGDIPFSVAPMNEADCYLISKIGMLDYTGIIERGSDPTSFREAADKYFTRSGERGSNTVKMSDPYLMPAMQEASRSVRFGDLGLSEYINIVDPRRTEQFSALTVTLPNGINFITFRGTDDNILAWKENFYLSCLDYVNAQRDALAYLRYHSTLFDGPIMLGGHSKGGNLAIYAACTIELSVRERIEAVYAFDSPGFHDEFYRTPGYKDMSSRIHKFIPKNSLVGTLMDNPDTGVTIVNSEDFAIAGHSGLTWETCPTGYVTCNELSKSSKVFDTSIDKVLDQMDIVARREFIDSLFDILDSTGATTITELTGKGRSAMLSLGLDLIKNAETKQFLFSVISQIARDYVAETQKNLREENRAHRKARDEMRQAKALLEEKQRSEKKNKNSRKKLDQS